jgi:hypothetical protein
MNETLKSLSVAAIAAGALSVSGCAAAGAREAAENTERFVQQHHISPVCEQAIRNEPAISRITRNSRVIRDHCADTSEDAVTLSRYVENENNDNVWPVAVGAGIILTFGVIGARSLALKVKDWRNSA